MPVTFVGHTHGKARYPHITQLSAFSSESNVNKVGWSPFKGRRQKRIHHPMCPDAIEILILESKVSPGIQRTSQPQLTERTIINYLSTKTLCINLEQHSWKKRE
jgi:hypothetical protein